ncbi:MAG: glycoside hydrolase family 57 protein [Rhodocyclaceae bacterium]|nr:glycoside hydrolase family 57 protein [Rhodocyclaceae bacterium]
MAANRLDLVFLWHMHQPDYRDHTSGRFVMPWTLLHALKDYTDMAAHFERHPAIRAVVNFVPVLLDQLDDYVHQFETGEFRDPLLAWLAREDLGALPSAERAQLLEGCFRCNHATMLSPFPRYKRLSELYESLMREGEAALAYLSGAYLADLVVWYLLAWTGETLRRQEPLLAELMAKGGGFTAADRRALLDLIGRTLASLVPRYRALAARGQIELSATPYGHPLAPLLLDFHAARESLPEAPLPLAAGYPGGRDRVRWHVEEAIASHARRFGAPPTGLWPAEGALSMPFVHLVATTGCHWLASGENVLKNSLAAALVAPLPGAVYQPWQLAEAPGLTLFFRDDRLSDLIGFEYSKWHGRDAAAHFIAQLEAIAAAAPPGRTPLVTVALDGENAWEYYPYNAFYFFEDLYGLLEAHPAIRTRTFAEVLDDPASHPPARLPHLTAGSWVYGTLSTWIGEPAKNHAWDLLCAAKQSFDQVMASGRLKPEEAAAATAQLAICESSDWFWWFGDANPAPTVISFDRLYRRNLANLYRHLRLNPPAQLDKPISSGRADGAAVEAGGTMRRGSESTHQAS